MPTAPSTASTLPSRGAVGGTGYALAAAAFGVVAAVVGLLLVAQIALGRPAVHAVLSPGRLRGVYELCVVLGVASLPLSRVMTEIAGGGRAGSGARSLNGGTWLWLLGTLLGVGAVAAGAMAPGVWAVAPWFAQIPLLLGGAMLAYGAWRGASERRDPLPVAAQLALVSLVALLAALGMGTIATVGTEGYAEALLGAAHAHGLRVLWVGTAGLALAAVLLPVDAGRPLFGRRVVWLAAASWLVLQSLAQVADLRPELLPSWLARPMDAIMLLLVIPVAAWAAALAGAFVAEPRGAPESAGLRFALAGAAALLAGTLAQAMLVPASRAVVGLTPFAGAGALLPPLAALWLLGIGATYAVWGRNGEQRCVVKPRTHLSLAIGAALLCWAPLLPIGLAQAATGPTVELLALQARLALPGSLALLVSSAVWLANMVALRAEPESRRLGRATGSPGAWGAPVVVGVAATLFAAVSFLDLFLPLADADLRVPTARAEARAIAPDSLPAEGREVYVREACAACHTQRVRGAAIDGAHGPAVRPGDFAGGSVVAGSARLGPDLLWAADRHATREAMLDALSVHGPDGPMGFPWLYGDGGPTARGGQLVDYLLRLTSGPGEE